MTDLDTARAQIRPRWRLGRFLAAGGVALLVSGWVLMLLGKQTIGVPAVVVGMALSTLGFAFLRSFEQLSLVRMIQDLPTSRIRSAPQGYVEIRGIVQPGSTLVRCPRCGLHCCWFQYPVNKGKSLVKPASADDVVVDDGTGRCLLRLAGAELISARRKEHAHAHVLPGDPVHVLGEFRTGATGPTSSGLATDPLASAELVRKKLQWLKYTRPKAVFDVNRDGRLDAREMEAMAKVAEQMVARDQTRAAAAPPTPDSMLGKPTSESDRLPFLVVVGTEHEALSAVRRAAAGHAVSTIVIAVFFTMLVLDISAHPPVDLPENVFATLSKPAARSTPAAAPRPATRIAPAPTARTPRQQATDLHRAKRIEEAVAAYDALLSDDPYDGEVAFWRGNALGALGRKEEAVAAIQRACDLGHGGACAFLQDHFPKGANPQD